MLIVFSPYAWAFLRQLFPFRSNCDGIKPVGQDTTSLSKTMFSGSNPIVKYQYRILSDCLRIWSNHDDASQAVLDTALRGLSFEEQK